MEQKPFEFEVKIVTVNKSWHDTIRITLSRGKQQIVTFTLAETIMGCGIAQLQGVGYIFYLKDEELVEFKDILQNKITNLSNFSIDSYKCFKVGYIICTLGEMFRNNSYINNESYLLKLGFSELSEYSNWRHKDSGEEIQKLYGLHTNFNNIKNKGIIEKEKLNKKKKKIE